MRNRETKYARENRTRGAEPLENAPFDRLIGFPFPFPETKKQNAIVYIITALLIGSRTLSKTIAACTPEL